MTSNESISCSLQEFLIDLSLNLIMHVFSAQRGKSMMKVVVCPKIE